VLPSDDADDLTWLLFRQQSVITLRQARRFFSEPAIRHRLRSGRWGEPHPRVFLTHGGAPVTDAQRLWIAALAAGPGALVAGCTAIGQYGLRRYSGSAVHLLLPARRQARRLPRVSSSTARRCCRPTTYTLARSHPAPCPHGP
jgi:hypothetical protein